MNRSRHAKRSGWCHPVNANRNHRRNRLRTRARSLMRRLWLRRELDRLAAEEAREIR